jgi:DNA-directed RNA polymerase subunit beta'
MPHYKNNKKFYLVLMSEENINIWNFLSKKLNNENLKLALSITNFAYVEPETILGFISIIPKKMGQIEKIEKLKRKTLIIKKDNFKQLYTENNLITTDKTRMIRVGDIIGPKLKVTSSGQIISRTPFKLNIHKSTPFFLTPNTKITKKNGDFIKQGELFGIIIFEQIVTGDIIQGLPKVEEILEGRIPKISLNFFKDFAFINNDGRLLKNNFLSTNIESIKKKYCFGQYFYIGKPDKTLTEGSIDPHDLLKSYFNYYNKYENSYEASYLSFKNIQVLLIEKVQQIYQSQGVTIADKHLEIILKRMTSKVKITNSGSSSLLLDELIELKQIGYINKVLDKTSKIKVKYEPILLGITKASLIADSFISAASFQETTKILTTAAIEGKIDWLRGLKENVIIGRLIPAGTGFRNA